MCDCGCPLPCCCFQLSLKLASQGGDASLLMSGLTAEPASREGAGAAGGSSSDPLAATLQSQPLITPREEEMMLTWVALVTLTLEELGVPRDLDPAAAAGQAPAVGGPSLRSNNSNGSSTAGQYLAGMAGYVQQTLAMYEGGQTLQSVAGLQELVQEVRGGAGRGGGGAAPWGEAGWEVHGRARVTQPLVAVGKLGLVFSWAQLRDAGRECVCAPASTCCRFTECTAAAALVLQDQGGSPALQMMQQYTRLVLLAVEVVAAMGLTTSRPLQPPSAVVIGPCSYSQAFTDSCSTAGLFAAQGSAASGSGGSSSDGGECPPRSLAVRLLVCFVGAVLGWPFSLRKFVECVGIAYMQVGWGGG